MQYDHLYYRCTYNRRNTMKSVPVLLLVTGMVLSGFAEPVAKDTSETFSSEHRWQSLSENEHADTPCKKPCDDAPDSTKIDEQNCPSTCSDSSKPRPCRSHRPDSSDCRTQSSCSHQPHPGSQKQRAASRQHRCHCKSTPDSLVILWATRDAEVFNTVIMPYSINSVKQEWWQDVQILIWGPSADLIKQNKDLQTRLETVKKAGITLTACRWCAEQYDAVPVLKEIGVQVEYMGRPLTRYLKSRKVLVF